MRGLLKKELGGGALTHLCIWEAAAAVVVRRDFSISLICLFIGYYRGIHTYIQVYRYRYREKDS